MLDKSSNQSLIQRALDIFETGSFFTRNAAMKCHMSGLQAEKRRSRYLYRKALNIVDYLQHSTWDIFEPGLELYPHMGSIDTDVMTDPKSCMRKIIESLWKIHDEAHAIANEMVVARLRCLSEPIYDFCNCVMTIISEMQRNFRSYELGGWDWILISRHQEADNNIHDEYEKKEESQGYSDHKEA